MLAHVHDRPLELPALRFVVSEDARLAPARAAPEARSGSEEERAAGLQAGFDFYLTKPIDFNQLRQAIGS